MNYASRICRTPEQIQTLEQKDSQIITDVELYTGLSKQLSDNDIEHIKSIALYVCNAHFVHPEEFHTQSGNTALDYVEASKIYFAEYKNLLSNTDNDEDKNEYRYVLTHQCQNILKNNIIKIHESDLIPMGIYGSCYIPRNSRSFKYEDINCENEYNKFLGMQEIPTRMIKTYHDKYGMHIKLKNSDNSDYRLLLDTLIKNPNTL